MARKIEIVVGADTRNAEKGFRSLSHSATMSFGSIAKLAIGLGGITAAIAGVNRATRAGISEFSEQQKVAAQTAAAIKSTGQVAGISAKQIDALGLSLSNLSGIDDEVVKAGENVLLAFTNIRNAAGKGNDIFTQATKAATDFAARTGKQVPAAALLLGKALQDPASKLSSLARAGVVFTKQQIAQVAAIQKTKGVMEAQKVVLAAFAQRYGGAAKALGQTLPGQLNVIRERLRDAAGDLVGTVAPAFTRVARSAADFVKRFSQAQTLRAKFRVVVEGLSGFGQQVLSQIQEQLRRINVEQVVGELQQRLLSSLQRIGSVLNRVDFRAVGQAVGDGLVRGLQGAAAFLQSVDWSVVGGTVVSGIRDFLTGVNWKAVAVVTVRLLVAGFRAQVQLVKGIGAALGQALLDGVRAGLDALGREAAKIATIVALKIVEPFSHLPSKLGEKARQAKDALKAELAEMEKATRHTADVIAGAVGERNAGGVNRSAAVPVRQTRTVAVAAIAPALEASKAVETAAEKAKKAFDRLLSGLQLGAEKAALTKTLGDDIAANTKIVAALRLRAAITKGDLDVQHQLVAALAQQKDLLQQQNALVKAAVQARQFRALGFAADGSEVVPGVANLRKQLGTLTDRLGASSVNLSSNLKSGLAKARKALSSKDPLGLGELSRDSRAKIQELFATIRGEFDKGAKGPLTKTHGLDTKKILEGLGLSPADASELRSRLSSVNSAGRSTVRAPVTSGGGFVGARPIVVESHTTVQLDGHTVGKTVTRSQQKTKRRNPAQRRGPNRPF